MKKARITKNRNAETKQTQQADKRWSEYSIFAFNFVNL